MRVLVVCARRYNGHELWTALGVLQEAGVDFEVVSTSKLIQDEVTHQPNTIQRTIDEVAPEELDQFDGLLIISGNMSDTEAYWTNERVLAYVNRALQNDATIGAICCSVPTVRQAAQGKKVSFYPLIRSRALLQDAGAICQTVSITVDGKLITAEHQMATQTWAEAFVGVLNGEDVDLGLTDSGFVPQGKTERALHPRLERLRGTDVSYRTRNNESDDR